MLAVTIDNLPGYEIKEVIGEVLGVVARPKNAYVEGVKTLTGTGNPNVTDHLVRVREGAVAHMLRVAYQRGANAVVGMRFDHRPISESWNEVCAYGTAVFVIPAPRHSPEVPGGGGDHANPGADAGARRERGPQRQTPEAQAPQAGPRAIGPS
jgi:uncharacterized protein YbjQ (UPF0145 family)